MSSTWGPPKPQTIGNPRPGLTKMGGDHIIICVPEPRNTGKIYGRKNREWIEIPPFDAVPVPKLEIAAMLERLRKKYFPP